MRLIVILAIAALLILSGCASVSQEKAQAIARVFVANNVKLYAKEESTINTNVTEPSVDLLGIDEEGAGWIVSYNISGMVNGAQKSAIVRVTISGDGKAVALNGKKLPG